MSTKRWLEPGSGADELEREVLRAGMNADPPSHAMDLVLGRLRTTLGPDFSGDGGSSAPPEVTGAATGASGAALGSKATSILALFGKGVVIGVGFSVAAAGGSRLLERQAPRHADSPASVEVSRPTPKGPALATAIGSPTPEGLPDRAAATGDPPPVLAPQEGNPPRPSTPPPVLATPESAPAPTAEAAAPLAVSQLQEEARMLRLARDELRAGSLAAAFATLESARRQFSAPELAQEREALTIELLYRSGETAAASERARAFIERFPESPHAARVRAFGATPP